MHCASVCSLAERPNSRQGLCLLVPVYEAMNKGDRHFGGNCCRHKRIVIRQLPDPRRNVTDDMVGQLIGQIGVAPAPGTSLFDSRAGGGIICVGGAMVWELRVPCAP